MKKILFIFICSLLLFFNGLAQGSWAFGIQVGENLTTLNGDVDSQYRLGYSFGAHASHYLTEKLVLRLEANFERKGAERVLPPNPFTPDIPTEIELDYLSLPVLLRYTTIGKKWRYVAGGGMAVSYLMDETTNLGEVAIIQTDDFNRVDADLIACLGTAYPLNDHLTLGFELRGNFGLVDVQRNRGTAMQLGRNVSWGMYVGLNYYL